MNILNKIEIDLTDDDPRIGHLLGRKLNDDDVPKAVLIGFPSDEGVTRNGGRAGASQAPDIIRDFLYKMTPYADETSLFSNLIEHTKDVGNAIISGDLEADQELLGDKLAVFLEEGIIPIILGGGHETAFGHFLGYAKANLKTAIFNLDAHADVRPLKDGKAHSGSPFRQTIEHNSGCCERYSVAGLQPGAVAKSHLQYITRRDGHYQFKNDTTITSITDKLNSHDSERLMVTFDMDAVDQAFAPGVSAPCANGLRPNLWLQAAYHAGKSNRVTSFDISEVNAAYDRDGQTARLAALTIWHFFRGLSQRR